MRFRIFGSVALIMLVSVVLVATPSPTSATFILAWEFPSDEYGQGIEALTVYENSTGSWLIANSQFSPNVFPPSWQFNWTEGVAIKIRVHCRLNATLVDVYSTNEGKNYLRHNVTLRNNTGSVLFGLQNFTYFNSAAVDDIYYYDYEAVLEYLLEAGQVYTATVTYEVWY